MLFRANRCGVRIAALALVTSAIAVVPGYAGKTPTTTSCSSLPCVPEAWAKQVVKDIALDAIGSSDLRSPDVAAVDLAVRRTLLTTDAINQLSAGKPLVIRTDFPKPPPRAQNPILYYSISFDYQGLLHARRFKDVPFPPTTQDPIAVESVGGGCDGGGTRSWCTRDGQQMTCDNGCRYEDSDMDNRWQDPTGDPGCPDVEICYTIFVFVRVAQI